MYTLHDYLTKKALCEAIARGHSIEVFSPGPFPCPQDGWIYLEGPHYPKPHTWYARARVEGGVVKEIR